MDIFRGRTPPSPINPVCVNLENMTHADEDDPSVLSPLTSTRNDDPDQVGEGVDVMDGANDGRDDDKITDEQDMGVSDILRRASSIKSMLVKKKKLSREAFFVQAGLIYIISISCIVNLSLGTGPVNVWIALLSGCLGYLLPEPKIRREKTKSVLDLPKDLPVG